jgi:hypothetical protein
MLHSVLSALLATVLSAGSAAEERLVPFVDYLVYQLKRQGIYLNLNHGIAADSRDATCDMTPVYGRFRRRRY